MKAVVYVRKSTNKSDSQKYTLELQKSKCIEFCGSKWYKVFKILEESESWKSINKRVKLKWILDNKDKFDILVVYKLDRLSRSAKDVLNIVRWKLEDKEVVFINDNIDTSTAQWRLFLTQLSGFAEFERELIVSRIKDWLEEAKKQWKTLWRPVSKEKSIKNLVDRIRSYRKWRKSWEEIAKLLNYKSRSTPYKIFMKYKKIYI